ncbi:MAG: DUF4185 domain-containing protein [Treponema sp.]|nr:DUF4185 domain-containing protein [Treponema sp.]
MRKQYWIAVTVLFFSLITVSTCATSGRPVDPGVFPLSPVFETELLPRQVGEFLRIHPLEEKYTGISDGFGMSGRHGRNHWHNNDPKTMYVGEKQDFVFDISFRIEQLGELHIWNYNEEGKTENGIRNITISLSNDNITYTEAGTFELAQASGAEKLLATNLTGGTSIDLAGKSARYIKLSPVDNYGGEEFGLSEIRLYRYKQDVFKGAYISASPLERYLNGRFISSSANYNLFNGAGLSDPFSADAVHDNNPAHMFADRNRKIAGFPIDLKGKYPVEKIVIWNYNGAGNTDWGLRKIRISYSEDGKNWIRTPEVYELPRAGGENNLTPSLVIEKHLYARYLRVDNLGNHGGSRAGLSAIRCYIGEGWFADDLPDWTALFSNYVGWSGSDGFFATSLDGRIYAPDRDPADHFIHFHFGDTKISVVNPRTDFRRHTYMPYNTAAALHGRFPDSTKITFTWPERNQAGTGIIMPDPPERVTLAGSDRLKFYWLGPSFVIGEKLYVTAAKIDFITEGAWGFWGEGADLARFDITDNEVDFSSLVIIKDTANRLSNENNQGNWMLTAGVFENTEQAGALNPDGYIYIYGYMDRRFNRFRSLIAARVKADEIENLHSWEYLLENNTWGREMTNPKILSRFGATEVSVTEIKTGPDRGKFLFVSTPGTIGQTIQISIASSLTEEFTNSQVIYHTDVPQSWPYNRGAFSSNAKVHAAMSNDRELYIAYNVNGDENWTYGDIYRPRYIRFARVPVIQ